ncbi:MAG: hypothetical protein K8S97_13800 [Anaerolineae bacterium]|nr:hypothetical protein [Anaerolineae bacterium]
MTDDDIRRDDDVAGDQGNQERDRPMTPADARARIALDDPVLKALKEIPKLRAIKEDPDGKGPKEFRPPPPMVSRIAGLVQGCGGILLILIAAVTVLAALQYGFYMWGPALLMVGGLVLTVGTVGVWRGNRVPVVVSITMLLMVVGLGYTWEQFIQIAGRLTPLGAIGMIVGLASSLVALVLLVALLSNTISLVYWKRLMPSTTRGITIWVGGIMVLIALALILHFTQQQQREAWINDHIDEWQAEAVTDTLTLGSSMNISLGYTFFVSDEDDESDLQQKLAELEAALSAGAEVIRLTASGDALLEVEVPMLFNDADDEAGRANAEARVAAQQVDEQAYMARIEQARDAGMALIIADYHYTPYLMVRSYDDEEKIPWVEFVEIQEARVRYYASTYTPEYYELFTEPALYDDYSQIDEPEGDNDLDAWVAQMTRLANAVREESPDTQIGLTVSVWEDMDIDIYLRALETEDIDFIGLRVFQTGAFKGLEEFFADNGHPRDFGKEVWIMETWFGACLAPQRSQDLDARWLEMATAFAAKEDMTAVLTADMGCFVREGGTLFGEVPDIDDRTDVWAAWRDLIVVWGDS